MELLEKLIMVNVVKKFLAFMESEGSFSCSQDPATGSCNEPVESAPSNSGSLRSSLMLTFHLCLGLPSCLFPFL